MAEAVNVGYFNEVNVITVALAGDQHEDSQAGPMPLAGSSFPSWSACHGTRLMLRTVHALWLQDGMQTRWPAPAVARHVERQLRQSPCDMVGPCTQPGNFQHLCPWCWRDSEWKADGSTPHSATVQHTFKHITTAQHSEAYAVAYAPNLQLARCLTTTALCWFAAGAYL